MQKCLTSTTAKKEQTLSNKAALLSLLDRQFPACSSSDICDPHGVLASAILRTRVTDLVIVLQKLDIEYFENHGLVKVDHWVEDNSNRTMAAHVFAGKDNRDLTGVNASISGCDVPKPSIVTSTSSFAFFAGYSSLQA